MSNNKKINRMKPNIKNLVTTTKLIKITNSEVIADFYYFVIKKINKVSKL